MSEQGQPTETIEEILANVQAAQKRQAAARRPLLAADRVPDGSLVVLSEAAHIKLGLRRARAADVVGIVLGFDLRTQRYNVGWQDGMIEPLSTKYVMQAEG